MLKRISILFTLLLLAKGIQADPCKPFSPISWTEGQTRYGFSISREQMRNYPEWDLQKPAPVPLHTAVQLATNKLRDVRKDLFGNVISSITISHYPCLLNARHYLYQISFKNHLSASGELKHPYTILVLADGTVIEPTKLN